MLEWRAASQSDFDLLRSFLVEREASCVSFTDRLHPLGSPLLPRPKQDRVFLGFRGRELAATLLQSRAGFVFPVLPSEEEDLGGKRLRKLLRGRPYSLMGKERDCARLEEILGITANERVRYFTMARTLDHLPEAGDTGFEVRFRRAGPADAEKLFPLQKAYEIEEVLLSASRFNERSSRMFFARALAKQVIVYAEIPGTGPVAKAGTNARGFSYDQIGGVFTKPAFRGRHLGREIMRFLLTQLEPGEEMRNVRRTSLFVKQGNTHAIQMYGSLGYVIEDPFTISYY
jgi:hypothetical protein